MELFKLLGTIAIDNAEANKALQKTSQEGSKTESKLGKVFGSIGRSAAAAGKAIATGLAVGATAMAGLTVKALQLSGDLEQNLGGAEAVFKDLGDSIDQMSTTIITGYDEATGKAITATTNLETVSKEAYKNMGLSQSDYLATANKMGALFKGAGFDTQESLDLASQAMQRAADVASIMGIDTEAAMEAVAGAAKGNFTMMDNLGVAMNDTAIGAYALEKGINKSTSEMTQQEKIGLAMEMFLEKTTYAAGNYAKENETLAGSLSTAKSALTNFLSGSGDVDSFVDSISNLADVVVTNLEEIVPRLAEGVVDIVGKVSEKLPDLIQTILPVLVSGAVTLVQGLVQALPGIIEALLQCLPDLIQGFTEILSSLITAIVESAPALIEGFVQAFGQVVEALPGIFQQIADALPTLLPQLIEGATNLILSLCEAMPQIIQSLLDALPGILQSILESLTQNLPLIVEGIMKALANVMTSLAEALPGIVQTLVDALPGLIEQTLTALVENLPMIIEALITLMLSIVEQLPVIIQALVDSIPTVISLLIQALLENLPIIIVGLIQVVWGIVQALPQIFLSLIEGVANIFIGIWDGIKSVFEAGKVGQHFRDTFNKAWEAIKNAWSSVTQWFSDLWDKIKEIFSKVGSFFADIFTTAWEGIKKAWSAVISFFTGIWNGIKQAFSAVGSWFSQIFTSAWNGIKTAWSSVGSFFSGIWSSIKTAFSSVGTWFKDTFQAAWDGICDIFDGIGEYFSGLWEDIKTAFTDLADKIGTAVGDAVKSGINGVLGLIEGAINFGIDLINGAIKLINKIPGVEISKLTRLSIPRLEQGGVLEKGQVGLLEGSGAEAVVPLENNAKWIAKTAEDLKKQLVKEGVVGGYGGGSVSIDTNAYKTIGKSLVQGLWDGMSSAGRWLHKNITGLGVQVLAMCDNAFQGAKAEKIGSEFGEKMARKVLHDFKAEAGATEEEVAQALLEAADKFRDRCFTYQSLTPEGYTLADDAAFWLAMRKQFEFGTEASLEVDKRYLAAKQALNDGILAAEEQLQEDLDAIYDKIDDRTKDILGTFELFEEFTEGNSKPKDWFEMNAALDSQIAALEMYDAEMDALKSKIGGTALFDELHGMGLEGLSQIQYINQMNDAVLQQYVEKYDKRAELAKELATEELAEESLAATEAAFTTFADTCDSMGVKVSDSTKAMQVMMSNAFSIINTDAENVATAVGTHMQNMADKFAAAVESVRNHFNLFKNGLAIPSLNFEGSVEVEGAESGVEWYAKAMNSPRLLNEPTIFGYDSKSGKYLGGGETGSEVVAGSQTLMNMIQSAVAEQNTTITIWLQKVFDVLAEYFPQMLGALEAPISFNPNAMASALAVPMNRELGKISSREDRGR